MRFVRPINLKLSTQFPIATGLSETAFEAPIRKCGLELGLSFLDRNVFFFVMCLIFKKLIDVSTHEAS